MNRIPFYALFRTTTGSCLSVPTVAAISCLLIIGFWLRIHNLGLLGFIVDEGHQALAVNGILKHGYPLVPSGVAYAWNLLYIYMQSFTALVFGLNEFSLRLPGVLFSLASIPLIYLFSRSLFDSKVGLLSAFLLTFSVWEIEVSRFARAYAVYQFFYILSLFTFYKGFIKGERLHQYLVPPVFILTYMFAPLGITLLMAFVVPFFIERYEPRRKLLVLLCGALTAGGFFIYERILRFLDSWFSIVVVMSATKEQISFLERIRHAIKTNLNTPEVGLMKHLYVQDYWIFLLLCAVFAMIVTFLLYKSYMRESHRVQILLVLPIIAFCFLYQFALAIALFGLYVLLTYREIGSLKSTPYALFYVSAAFALLFWFTYANWYPLQYVSFSKYFWDYPKLYDYFLHWMFEGWPRFTLVTGIGLLVMGCLFLRDRTRSEYLYIVLLCLLLPLFASFLYWPFYMPRYAFHMYPLLIVGFAFTLCTLSGVLQRRLAIGGETFRKQGVAKITGEAFALVLLAVMLSQDVYPWEAWAISKRTYTSAKDPIKAAQSWEPVQQDYKTPGLFVRTHMGPRDTVVVLGASHVASLFYHYIGRVDYVLMLPHEISGNGSSKLSFVLHTDRGPLNIITGSAVLTDTLSFDHLLSIARSKRIWILADFQTAPQETVQRLSPDRVFTGQDQKTSVYLIDRRSAALGNSRRGLYTLPDSDFTTIGDHRRSVARP